MSAFDSQTYPGQSEGKQINAPILDFRNRIGDLARPNLFQVEIGFPQIVDNGTPQSGATPGSQEQRGKKVRVNLVLDLEPLLVHLLLS